MRKKSHFSFSLFLQILLCILFFYLFFLTLSASKESFFLFYFLPWVTFTIFSSSSSFSSTCKCSHCFFRTVCDIMRVLTSSDAMKDTYTVTFFSSQQMKLTMLHQVILIASDMRHAFFYLVYMFILTHSMLK